MNQRGSMKWALGALFGMGAVIFGAGCSTSVTSTGSEPGSSELLLSEDADPNGCMSGTIGDGVTCEDPGQWKVEASDACSAEGLILVDLQFGPDCADGRSTHATFGCCASPPPPPAPDPDACTVHTLGDGATCQSVEQWKTLLSDGLADGTICSADGFTLYDIGYFYDCADGGSTQVKIACCKASNGPPAPDPGDGQVCASGALGDGTTCKANADWTAETEAICGSKNLTITDFWLANDCGPDASTVGKFVCCAQ